jgi:hypothetical protein
MLLVLIQTQVRLVIRFNHTAIQGNQNYALEVTQGTITIIKSFR